MSWSLAPGSGGDSGLLLQTPWYNIKFPTCCALFLQVVPCRSPTVPCWVGKASTWDRHPPEKSLRSSLRSRHSLHPSCLFLGGEHTFILFGLMFCLTKTTVSEREKKKLKTVSPPSPSDRFPSPKLFWVSFPVRQFWKFPHPPIHCICQEKCMQKIVLGRSEVTLPSSFSSFSIYSACIPALFLAVSWGDVVFCTPQ